MHQKNSNRIANCARLVYFNTFSKHFSIMEEMFHEAGACVVRDYFESDRGLRSVYH